MMEPKNLVPSDGNVLRAVRHIQNGQQKLRNKQLQGLGLTSSQSDVILFLLKYYQEIDEINQLDVQRYLQLSNPTVSGILSRLEDKGFITRTSSRRDARYKCIYPTQKALDLNARMHEHSCTVEHLALKGLSEDEQKELLHLLEHVRRNVETELQNLF